MGRILSRDNLTLSVRGGGIDAYSDVIAHALSGKDSPAEVTGALARAAAELELSDDQVLRLHQEALDGLMAAAARDTVTSSAERDAIIRAADALGLPRPALGEDSAEGIDSVLVAGARVCFTGAATDLSGEPIDRPELHEIAERHGLVPVTSVTQKKCEVVIAADASSMSGKAKKARDYGKPVYSVHDFLSWAEDH